MLSKADVEASCSSSFYLLTEKGLQKKVHEILLLLTVLQLEKYLKLTLRFNLKLFFISNISLRYPVVFKYHQMPLSYAKVPIQLLKFSGRDTLLSTKQRLITWGDLQPWENNTFCSLSILINHAGIYNPLFILQCCCKRKILSVV